jgi:hypothetical protein
MKARKPRMRGAHSRFASLEPRIFFRYRESAHSNRGSPLVNRDFCDANREKSSVLRELRTRIREVSYKNHEVSGPNREKSP